MAPVTLTRQQYGQTRAGQRDHNYGAYLRFIRARRGGGGAAQRDPFAPLPPAEIQREARQQVSAQIDPLIAEITRTVNARAAAEQRGIAGLTQSYADRAAQLSPALGRDYGQATHAQAALDAAIAARTSGQGADLSNSLAAKLGAINAPGAQVAQVAGGAAATGTGAANAGYGIGSASLAELIANAASAKGYADKLPSLAQSEGLQYGAEAGARNTRDLETQVGDIRSRVPGLVASTLQSLQNRELQKGIARSSGLVSAVRATQQGASLTERQRHDRATEANAAASVAARKSRDAQILASKTATAQQKSAAKREQAFYATREKTFQAAKKLAGKPTAGKAAGGSGLSVPGASSAKQQTRVPYDQAYRSLYNEYGLALVNQYGFKSASVAQMIRRALASAGYKTPGRGTGQGPGAGIGKSQRG